MDSSGWQRKPACCLLTNSLFKVRRMEQEQLIDFAQRYTEAWCSQNAASVAAFFSANGSLSINNGTPAVGTRAITEAAQSFMTAFPDLRVAMEDVVVQNDRAEYHWILTGTNTGPGGTGNQVCIRGYELWRFGPDELIAESLGSFDAGEYQHQLEHGLSTP
jgi:hypothetical protein